MENNFESQFKKLAESTKLSENEQAYHKSKLLKLIDNSKPKTSGVPSPFLFMFPKTKAAMAGFAFLLFFTTGLVSSAKSALPNQYLYVFRIKVIEPTQVFMARGIKEKNDTRIALIKDRLEDFSKVSLKEKFSPEAEASFASSFSMEIKEVQEEITKQAEIEDVSEALSTANDLQSVLSAHSLVINKVLDAEPQENKMELSAMMIVNSSNLSANIDESLDNTKKIIDGLTVKLQSTEEASALEEALGKQKLELAQSYEEIKTITQSQQEELRGGDETYIGAHLEEIDGLLKESEETASQGNNKETLNIYNAVDQKIGELRNLIESKKELGVDIIDEGSEVEGEIEILNTVED